MIKSWKFSFSTIIRYTIEFSNKVFDYFFVLYYNIFYIRNSETCSVEFIFSNLQISINFIEKYFFFIYLRISSMFNFFYVIEPFYLSLLNMLYMNILNFCSMDLAILASKCLILSLFNIYNRFYSVNGKI